MPKTSPDRGFTLIEVMVTIVLLSIMMTIAVTSFWGWTRANEQSGTARTLQSALRQAQQRAITEGRTICVKFDLSAGTYTITWATLRTDPTLVCKETEVSPVVNLIRGPIATAGKAVHFGTAAFSSPAGTSVNYIGFTPHGSAWPGTVTVTRDGSSKTYKLTVEGLTGRASLT